jgi:tetratricopeptide (TPR) repeat protein
LSRDGWFRKRTWSPEDQTEFHARLARSRDGRNKAQYLRIQASELASTGDIKLTRAALTLLGTLFSDFPDALQLGCAHLLAAECYARLGDFDSAVDHYRRSLTAQVAVPNVDPGTALEFPWFIASHHLSDLHDEALAVLDRAHLAFPVQKFKAAAVRALVAEHRGDALAAARHASEALEAANARQSGFAYHQSLGLVGQAHEGMLVHLRRLAAA